MSGGPVDFDYLETYAGGDPQVVGGARKQPRDRKREWRLFEERPCVTRELRIADRGHREVRSFAQYEMARTVEDVLARRTRTLFLDQKAALAQAPEIARVLAEKLGRDAAWQQSQLAAFAATAAHFAPPP